MFKKLAYEVRRNRVNNSEFERLTISVYPFPSLSFAKPYCRIDWSTKDGSPDWHTGRLTIEAKSYEELQEAYKVSSKILRGMTTWEPDVNEVLDKLERIAVEVVYDKRLSERVPLVDIPPVEQHRYIDDYNQFDNHSRYGNGCKYGVLAETECEAQKKMLIEAAEQEDDDFVTAFVAAGKPVFIPNHSEAPDITPGRVKVEKDS